MDKTRYISIAIILAIVFPIVFITGYAGTIGSYIGSSLYMICGMYALWEILTSIGYNKIIASIVSVLIIPFFVLGGSNLNSINGYIFDSFTAIASSDIDLENKRYISDFIKVGFGIKNYLILLIPIGLLVFSQPEVNKKNGGHIVSSLNSLFIIFIAFTFFKGAWIINSVWKEIIFFFISISIFADSFGYWGGKFLGKMIFNGAKLAPKISPNKTWAGAIIGFIVSFMFTLLVGYYTKVWISIWDNNWAISSIMAILLSLISPIGDLFFSQVKRLSGIKDFSNLLPGHGGIFDRIDSSSFVISISIWLLLIF